MKPVHAIFCVTAKSGLGHLVRVSHIARKMREISKLGQLHLLTNAAPPDAVFHNRMGKYNPFDRVVVTEKQHFATAITESRSNIAVVDTAVVPHIDQLAVPIVLIMREAPDDVLPHFSPGAKQGWDLVIVPNPKSHWSPDHRLLPAQFVQHVGWVYDDSVSTCDKHSAAHEELPLALEFNSRESLKTRRVLLCAGGGGNPDWQIWHGHIRTLLGNLNKQLTYPLRVTQLLGPRSSSAARIDCADDLIRSASRVDLLIERHDLVITACGYNTMLEIARCTTPALLVPLSRTFDNQRCRAEQWATTLGLEFRPDNMQCISNWSTRQLQFRLRRKVAELGPSGAAAAAILIRQIACNSLVSTC